jgi:hypothetical protein
MSPIAEKSIIQPKRMAKKTLAVEMLAAGHSYSKTADAIGVSKASVQNWMNDPEFRGRVEARREEFTVEFKGRVYGLLDKAINTYDKALTNGNVSTSAIKAASEVLHSFGLIKEYVEPLSEKAKGEVIEIRFGASDVPLQKQES